MIGNNLVSGNYGYIYITFFTIFWFEFKSRDVTFLGTYLFYALIYMVREGHAVLTKKRLEKLLDVLI